MIIAFAGKASQNHQILQSQASFSFVHFSGYNLEDLVGCNLTDVLQFCALVCGRKTNSAGEHHN